MTVGPTPTLSAFGVSLILSRRFASWMGWLGLIGGLGTIAAGVAHAYSGFSPLAMVPSMSASSVLLLWVIMVGVRLRRFGRQLADSGSPGAATTSRHAQRALLFVANPAQPSRLRHEIDPARRIGHPSYRLCDIVIAMTRGLLE